MRKVIVELVLDHKQFTYDQICAELGRSADYGWNVGDPITNVSLRYTKTYEFSRWALTEESGNPDEIEGALEALDRKARPILQRAERFLATNDFSNQLVIQIDETKDVLGFGIPARIVELVNVAGASIDISVAVMR